MAFEIGCKPADLPRFMLRKVGQEVKKGQMIAKKGETQAFFTKTALAPISGVISKIDEKTGKVTIARPFKEVRVNAYVRGQVSSIIENRGCVVETPGVRLTGMFGVGRETHGAITVVAKGPDQVLQENMIPEDCRGKILVGGSLVTNGALSKALQTSAKGIIAATVSYLSLVESLGVKLGVGVTGLEDVDMTVILTEGFGNLSMRAETWEALCALSGRTASINGATQIRAGAIRPEVIVPIPEYAGDYGSQRSLDEDLKVGAKVRIASEPYFGELGQVVAIDVEPHRIETEALVPMAKIALADGRVVSVPRPNIEAV